MGEKLVGAAYMLALTGLTVLPTTGVAQTKPAKCGFKCQARRLGQAVVDSSLQTGKARLGVTEDSSAGTLPEAGEDGRAATPASDASAVRETTDRRATAGRRPGCTRNDTFQCAAPATVGGTIRGSIGSDDARTRFYELPLSQAGVLRLSLTSMPNRGQMTVTVSDEQKHDIRRMVFQPGEPGDRLMQVAASGTYFLKLWSGGREPEPFSLQVTNAPHRDQSGTCPVNDTFQCALSATLRDPISGALGTDDIRNLYYKFSVSDPGTVRVNLSAMPRRGQVVVEVTDSQHDRVGRLVFEAGEPGARPVPISAPGTYYLHLWSGTNTAEPFSLTLTQPPTPR